MSKMQWVVSIYNNNFDVVKPIRYVVGTYEKAEKVCEILQHKNPKKIIMFDHA